LSQELSPEQVRYVQRLAYRYVKYRKSASIDVQDLVSAANIRWWQFGIRHPDICDEKTLQICFYQQVKGAMRDIIRESSPVKVTRTMQAQMQAYQKPYAVSFDHVVDVQAGEHQPDLDVWLDVVNSLKKLPEREQVILSLYIEQGYSYSEIAEIYEVSVSTITRAYRKAIDLIKQDLTNVNDRAKKRSI